MSLYIKYRPTSFTDFKGNDGTVASLTSVLSREDKPHAFLFTGPSGCGKTTLARIAAAECGATGLDYVEVDSADFRGIDSIRDIRRNAQFKPLQGTSRAWLLDECHQMSKDAMHALLKLLEDTPSHVYLFLATTDPQKLLPTVVNRCSRFDVAPLSDNELMALVRRVAKAEGCPISKDVLGAIVDSSGGSSRKALVSLERVIGLDDDDALGILAEPEADKAVIDLCRELMGKGDAKKVAAILKSIKDEPESVRRAVMGYCRSAMLGSGLRSGKAYLVMDAFRRPFYDNGDADLVMACYEALNGE